MENVVGISLQTGARRPHGPEGDKAPLVCIRGRRREHYAIRILCRCPSCRRCIDILVQRERAALRESNRGNCQSKTNHEIKFVMLMSCAHVTSIAQCTQSGCNNPSSAMP